MAPAGPPSLLTVRTVDGKEASIELREGHTVQELRHRVAEVLGLLQVRSRLAHGRVLASNQIVADLLGLSVSEEDVVPPPTEMRGRRAHAFFQVHQEGDIFNLGKPEGSLEHYGPSECLESMSTWEVGAIACLDTPEGCGYVLFGRE
jgi:hypothetical protein